MRKLRMTTGLVTLGLVGLVPLSVAAPAEAATAYTTTTALTTQPQVVEYDDDFSVSGNISAVDATGKTGYPSSTGTVSLQVYSATNPVWTTVATDTGSYFYFSDVKPTANSQYKVVYSGGTSTSGDTFTASESAPLQIGVQRKVKVSIKSSKLTLVVKVTPDFAKKKIQVKIKKGKKYKPLKKVKTNKAGKASIKLPGKKGGGKLYFRVIVPGDANYVGWQGDYYTTVY